MKASLRTTLLCLSFALATTGASAQTAEDKSSAKKALEEANRLSQKGDQQAALVQYRAAYAFAATPVTGVMLGKALMKAGKLVEARETFAAVEGMAKKPSESKASDDARQEAAKLKLEVTERIPGVTLTVEGVEPGAIPTVRLDDREVPAATLGVERRLDPGTHVLVASSPAAPEVKKSFSVVERQKLTVTLRLEPKLADQPKPAPGGVEPAAPAAGTAQPIGSKTEPTPTGADGPSPTTTKTVTAFPWKASGLVVSGVGMVVGGVGAYLYFTGANTKSDLAASGCTRDVCVDPGQRSSFQTADSQAKNGTAMLIGGGVLFAAGLVTFLVAPSSSTSPTSSTASTSSMTWQTARIDGVRIGYDRLELVGRF